MKPDEFTELLSVIYPSHAPVTKDNVEYLLELADKLQINTVLEECVKWLEQAQSRRIPLEKKLLWADKYRLLVLQNACIGELQHPSDVRMLRKAEEYSQLSDATKASVLERLLKVLPENL